MGDTDANSMAEETGDDTDATLPKDFLHSVEIPSFSPADDATPPPPPLADDATPPPPPLADDATPPPPPLANNATLPEFVLKKNPTTGLPRPHQPDNDGAETPDLETKQQERDLDDFETNPDFEVVPDGLRRLAHLDEYQHSSPVPLALFLVIFFILGMMWLRSTRSSAEPKKRCRKAKANDAKLRNSLSYLAKTRV